MTNTTHQPGVTHADKSISTKCQTKPLLTKGRSGIDCCSDRTRFVLKGRFYDPGPLVTNGLLSGKDVCQTRSKMRRFCTSCVEMSEQFCGKK